MGRGGMMIGNGGFRDGAVTAAGKRSSTGGVLGIGGPLRGEGGGDGGGRRGGARRRATIAAVAATVVDAPSERTAAEPAERRSASDSAGDRRGISGGGIGFAEEGAGVVADGGFSGLDGDSAKAAELVAGVVAAAPPSGVAPRPVVPMVSQVGRFGCLVVLS